MPLDFPTNPVFNQTYALLGRTWRWDGVAWKVLASPPPESVNLTGIPTAATAPQGTDTTQLATTEFVQNAADAVAAGAAISTHTHGNISNAGAIGSTANLPIITGTSGLLQAGSFGTTAGTFCEGNDPRLSGSSFSSGTEMLFVQTAAPTGWTKNTTHNNKALRIVSGTAGSGGSTAFTTAFASRTPTGSVAFTTLTTGQMPSHGHTYIWRWGVGTVNNGSGGLAGPFWYETQNSSSDFTGGGQSHGHSLTLNAMDFAVAYVDSIIATKD